MASVQTMCDFVREHAPEWYDDWCASDGSLKDLIVKYLELGGNDA